MDSTTIRRSLYLFRVYSRADGELTLSDTNTRMKLETRSPLMAMSDYLNTTFVLRLR